MPIHTVAFVREPTKASATREFVPVLIDTFFAVQGTNAAGTANAFLLPDKMHLVAAYAIGEELARAQIVAPSLLSVGYPFIRPLEAAATTTPASDPNFQVFHDGSVVIPSGEPLMVGVEFEATAVGAGAQTTAVALLWFSHQHHQQHEQHAQHGPEQPHHAGHASHEPTFWLRYELVAGGDGAGNTVKWRWSQFSIEFDQTLPAGTYAVVGFEHIGATAISARLIFPGCVHRPATVAGTKLGSRTYQGFYEGLFGIYGHFKTISLPYVEVLTTASDVANQHEGYLRVIRVGDLDHPGALGHGGGWVQGGHEHAASHGAPSITAGGAVHASSSAQISPGGPVHHGALPPR